jgi:putative restriction endonuclease
MGGAVYAPDDLDDEAVAVVRDAAFRRIVVAVYEFRCAFCRVQVVNTRGKTIVDGAHIKPFSRFYDDRIDNGLSLCKNHHWAFDQGWFAIKDDYRIIVSESLREESPHATPMRNFIGETLLLPHKYHPRLEALRRHREHIFDKGL